jgi:hypothetical protein
MNCLILGFGYLRVAMQNGVMKKLRFQILPFKTVIQKEIISQPAKMFLSG